MYEEIAKRLLIYAIKNNLIDESESDIYFYAYIALLSHCFSLFSIFVIGILSNRILETGIFLISFYPIRVYAGGFHKDTFKKCYFSSITLFTMIILLEEFLLSNMFILRIMLVLSVIITFIEIPQQSDNKPLSKDEVLRYKKQGRYYLLLVLLFLMSIIILGAPHHFQYYISSGIITVGLLLALGKNKS